MGTRGFVGFVIDQNEKIAYNHWDSYPSGLGVDVLAWLRDADHANAAEQARQLRTVASDSTPTEADVKRLAKWADLGVGEKSADDWYCLLRKTQGNPGAMLEAGVVEDAGKFPLDSLFAEYGYVVDFDQRFFEAYEGFQRAEHHDGRFANRSTEGNGYQPVRLVASWPFDQLPDDTTFLGAFTSGDSED